MKEKRMAGLLAALKREAPDDTDATEPAPATLSTQVYQTTQFIEPTNQKSISAKSAKKARGTAVQFWLRDEDRQLIRELSTYLAAQGERCSDSLVVRAALRLARADASLLRAFQQALAMDGRRRDKKQGE
jgi:hypothetical protein